MHCIAFLPPDEHVFTAFDRTMVLENFATVNCARSLLPILQKSCMFCCQRFISATCSHDSRFDQAKTLDEFGQIEPVTMISGTTSSPIFTLFCNDLLEIVKL